MFFSINFERLPGFSRIFLDFLYSDGNFFFQRFPANEKCFFSGKHLLKRAETFQERNRLIELIKSSSPLIKFSNKQDFFLRSLALPNSVVIFSSCFPGFLCGPMATFLKVFTVVALAREFSQKFPEVAFVPLLWVDDDSIGSSDSKFIYTYDSVYNLRLCKGLTTKDTHKGISISEIILDEIINEVIPFFLTINQIEDREPELSRFLKEVYYVGNSWCEAFIESINYFFNEMGLLFIRSSLARNLDFFYNLVCKEILLFGLSNELVERNLKKLEKFGYSFRTKSQIPNLQFHNGNEIVKIKYLADSNEFLIANKILSATDFINHVSASTRKFSPNSILKPIFQNYIMPSVGCVVSSSEIGYYLLLREVFEKFDVFFPLLVPRYSSTIICQQVLDRLKMDLQSILEKLKDNKFVVEAFKGSITNFLFPKKNLQERLITPFYFLTLLGKKKFRIFLKVLESLRRDQHHFILV